MANTTKKETQYNTGNVLSSIYNTVDKSISTGGFLVGKVGRKITKIDVDSVTEDYEYSENGVLLYTYRMTYTDSTKETFSSVERIV